MPEYWSLLDECVCVCVCVTVVRLSEPHAVKYGLCLNMDERYRGLKRQLSGLCAVPVSQLLLVDVYGTLVRVSLSLCLSVCLSLSFSLCLGVCMFLTLSLTHSLCTLHFLFPLDSCVLNVSERIILGALHFLFPLDSCVLNVSERIILGALHFLFPLDSCMLNVSERIILGA